VIHLVDTEVWADPAYTDRAVPLPGVEAFCGSKDNVWMWCSADATLLLEKRYMDKFCVACVGIVRLRHL